MDLEFSPLVRKRRASSGWGTEGAVEISFRHWCVSAGPQTTSYRCGFCEGSFRHWCVSAGPQTRVAAFLKQAEFSPLVRKRRASDSPALALQRPPVFATGA